MCKRDNKMIAGLPEPVKAYVDALDVVWGALACGLEAIVCVTISIEDQIKAIWGGEPAPRKA